MNCLVSTDMDGEWWVEDESGRTELLRIVLKRLRLQRGFKIAELERMAGVVHPGYHTFEHGDGKSIKQLPDIIDALGFDLRIVSKGRS